MRCGRKIIGDLGGGHPQDRSRSLSHSVSSCYVFIADVTLHVGDWLVGAWQSWIMNDINSVSVTLVWIDAPWNWHVFLLQVFFSFFRFFRFLADRTATQYDRLLASSCCPSVCPSVCLWRCALWLSGLVYAAKSCTSVFYSRCADCGRVRLRTQICSNCWICGLTANGFFYSEVEMLRSQWIALIYCMQYDRLSQQ